MKYSVSLFVDAENYLQADYSFDINNPKWNLVLEIRIDEGGGEKVRLSTMLIIKLFIVCDVFCIKSFQILSFIMVWRLLFTIQQ